MKTFSLSKIVLFLCLVTSLASCQKEVSFQEDQDPGGDPPPGPGANDILGDWNFIGEEVDTRASLAIVESGSEIKAVTTSSYITTENTGSAKITANQFIFTGISTRVTTVANTKTYLDGILFDDTDTPFDEVTPPTDNTADYVRNSPDSITFPNAFALVPDVGGTGTPTLNGPLGARISVSNDTLTMRIKSGFVRNVIESGIPAIMDVSFAAEMKFEKK